MESYERMKCKTSNRGCVYHACMSDDCQKAAVLRHGTSYGKGKCEAVRYRLHYRIRKQGYRLFTKERTVYVLDTEKVSKQVLKLRDKFGYMLQLINTIK